VYSDRDLLRWSEALAGIARTGLGFTESLYERERFEEVLAVAAEIRAMVGTPGTPDTIVDEWMKQVGQGIAGYQTPKSTVGAIVHNERGELLLVKRRDAGVWLYPTGWADVGYSASEVAIKEVLEETGIECEIVRLVAVLDGLRQGFSRIPLYSMVFLCRATGGSLTPHPLECLDVGFFAEDAMPEPLAGGDGWKALAFAAIRGDATDTVFDHPRAPVWRGEPDHAQPGTPGDTNGSAGS
jgi:ADP-ribose pyrophosphatase YjhB (NUDIX family)